MSDRDPGEIHDSPPALLCYRRHAPRFDPPRVDFARRPPLRSAPAPALAFGDPLA